MSRCSVDGGEAKKDGDSIRRSPLELMGGAVTQKGSYMYMYSFKTTAYHADESHELRMD